jgi:hypothetical protein
MSLSINGVPCNSHQRQTVPSNAEKMIPSTSSSDRTARTDAVSPVPSKPVVRGPGADQFSAGQSAALRSALAAQPEIRPEVVERAKALAADPNYPPRDVLAQVAGLILASPDLTADES